MTDEQLRTIFWEKMDNEERSFAWFHRKYLKNPGLKYNTLYKQAKGQELTDISEELKNAIEKFIGE